MTTGDNTDSSAQSAGGKPARNCPLCGQMHEPGGDCEDALAESAQRTDNLIGKTVGGKYMILAHLGDGGMSRVYKAKQMPINRIVALKMLQARLSQKEDSVMRFLQEARAAGQVSHANVVNIFDFGIAEDNQPYLVMDFLEGETLGQLLRRKTRLAYEDAIPIFTQICDGLAAAHEAGVVHRDIKPSNILLQPVPEGLRVRIVDFGIAKMINTDAQHLTKTGEVFGSPFYMSPEQCAGDALDNRSDIYSLGVVFYETLTGKLPLAGRTAMETMHLHLQSIPLSLQKAAGQDAHIPLSLENIVFRMMERQRERRYASVLEVKNDLKQVAAGHSEMLSGNLSLARRELARKSRILTGALVAATILGLSGVIAYPYACGALAQQQLNSARLAITESKSAEAESCLRSAIDLSTQAHNRPLTCRSLSLLIQVYSTDPGKGLLLQDARAKRRELIRTELDSFDIKGDSLNTLMGKSLPDPEIMSAAHKPNNGPGAVEFAKKEESVSLGVSAGVIQERVSNMRLSRSRIRAHSVEGGGGRGGLTSSPVQSQSAPVPQIRESVAVCDESLERLQLILDRYLQMGMFDRARECASRAIVYARGSDLVRSNELSKLYCARAWSCLCLGDKSGLQADLNESLQLAQSSGGLPEEAEARAVEAVALLEAGKKELATQAITRVHELLSQGVPAGPILNAAKARYEGLVK